MLDIRLLFNLYNLYNTINFNKNEKKHIILYVFTFIKKLYYFIKTKLF